MRNECAVSWRYGGISLEISTVAGMIVGVLAVVIGMALKGAPPEVLVLRNRRRAVGQHHDLPGLQS